MLAILILLYPALWGPFEPGMEPRALPVRRVEASMVQDTAVFRVGAESLTFRHASEENGFIVAEMRSARIEVARGYQLPREAFIADFNSDGEDDVAALVPSGGNGLAAERHWLVLFLSAKDQRHVPHTMQTMAPSERDFVIVAGRPAIIRTSFVYGEPGRDERPHNYWVYELLQCRGTNVSLANGLLRGFPKWVMFTFRENHRATSQLTPQQKRRLWNRPYGDAHDAGRVQ